MISPRARLIHARLWLGSEVNCPLEFLPGVALAIKKIESARDTVYSNSTHSSRRCKRCLEVAAVAKYPVNDDEPDINSGYTVNRADGKYAEGGKK